jgi:hypothetical protein
LRYIHASRRVHPPVSPLGVVMRSVEEPDELVSDPTRRRRLPVHEHWCALQLATPGLHMLAAYANFADCAGKPIGRRVHRTIALDATAA